MDWRCFAEDALDVVAALDLDRPVAFGHSCGGAVLLQAEELRPGTFGAVYAYEPIVAPPELWARMGERGNPSSAARRRRPDFASRAAALEHLSARSALSSVRGDVLVDYVEGGFADRPDGTVHLRCTPEAEAATYAMAPHAFTWERLPEVGCPVTVACGGARADFGRNVAAAVAGRLPHGRIEEHPDLGHLGPFEQPEAVADAVAAALAD
jgi:pimeloyl-ACP methyl ester carboxylesterase